jgi:hypothetical protein
MRPISLQDHKHLKFNCVMELYYNNTSNLNTSAITVTRIYSYFKLLAEFEGPNVEAEWKEALLLRIQDPRFKFRPRDRLCSSVTFISSVPPDGAEIVPEVRP